MSTCYPARTQSSNGYMLARISEILPQSISAPEYLSSNKNTNLDSR